jgi:molecular chaperone DnaJ
MKAKFFICETCGNQIGMIKNKGVPNMRTSSRGDLEFKVDIDVPKKLNEKQKEALRQFAELSNEEVSKKKNFWEKK